MGRKNNNRRNTDQNNHSEFTLISRWQQQIKEEKVALKYHPMIDYLIEEFSLLDKLPDAMASKEPHRDSQNITTELEEIRTQVHRLLTIFSQELKAIEIGVKLKNSSIEPTASFESIEQSYRKLQSPYRQAFQLAERYNVPTASISNDYQLLETALAVRGEYESLKSLESHQAEHLNWRYVYIGTFESSFNSFLQAIESASRKPRWLRLLSTLKKQKTNHVQPRVSL